MKLRSLFLLLTVCLLTINSLSGQVESRLFLSLEAGIDGISCHAPEKDYIRPVYDRATHYSSDQIRSLMSIGYIGLRLEQRIADNRLGLSTGLIYSLMFTSVGRDTYFSGGPGYFYVDYRQSGLETEYARVKEINQRGGYLGIPLEVRIYRKKQRLVQYYYKAGVSYNFRVHSSRTVSFYNESMAQYHDEVLSVIEEVPRSFTAIHFGLGLKLGKSLLPAVAIETYTPLAIVFPKGSYLADPISGSGLRLTLAFPLQNREQ